MVNCTALILAVVALLAVPARAQAKYHGCNLDCPPAFPDKIEAFDDVFCSKPCNPGYTRGSITIDPSLENFDTCYQDCPAGFRDDGLYCAKPSAYGRGWGYAIWAEGKCNSEHSDTGCERCLAMWYPKCKPGFHPVGCNICSPDCPAGMTDIGVSCKKDKYFATFAAPGERILTDCPSG